VVSLLSFLRASVHLDKNLTFGDVDAIVISVSWGFALELWNVLRNAFELWSKCASMENKI
jgi:hypothetical protein